MRIEKRYEKLPKAILEWYAKNARKLPWREDNLPYHVWVSEIMLQQTRVEAVVGYYNRFLKALPDIKALSCAPEGQLLKLWEGLGYYNRVRNMQKAARVIMDKFDGVFPQTYEEVLSLPGIGAYTAGAICSICFGLPRAAVDGNVLRVLSRITALDKPIDTDETKKDIALRLERVYPKACPGMFTQALMELGACVCTPKLPSCATCPCAAFCKAHESGNETKYPLRLPKREKRVEKRSVFLLECDGEFALLQRENSGLLSGLWQLPNTEKTFPTPSDALEFVQKMYTNPKHLVRTMERVHIFTHIRWEMTCYHVLCREKCADLVWASPKEIRELYALPTAFRIFLEDLNQTAELQ